MPVDFHCFDTGDQMKAIFKVADVAMLMSPPGEYDVYLELTDKLILSTDRGGRADVQAVLIGELGDIGNGFKERVSKEQLAACLGDGSKLIAVTWDNEAIGVTSDGPKR